MAKLDSVIMGRIIIFRLSFQPSLLLPLPVWSSHSFKMGVTYGTALQAQAYSYFER
jgi:hypothetical protein